MSETEYFTGKLTPVKIVGDIEQTARMLLKDEGVADIAYFVHYDTYLELLEFVRYTFFLVSEDKKQIYKVEYKEKSNDIYEAVKNDDETIDFTVRYYSGGCTFDEAVQLAIKNIKDK